MANTLPVSTSVVVNISRDLRIPSRLGFGTALLVGTSDVISTDERIRYYLDMQGVADDFDATAEEYKAASAYFSPTPRPERLAIGRRVNAATYAELRSGIKITTDIATWASITDGEFRISIDGDLKDVTNINFTGVTSLAGVAAKIQDAMRIIASPGFTASTCIYNAKQSRFIIRSGTIGVASTISKLTAVPSGTGQDISGAGFAATATAKLLDCADEDARNIQGLDAEAIATSLDKIVDANDDWYGLAFTKEVRDNPDAEAAAEWVKSRVKILGLDSNDANILDSTSTTDIAYRLHDAGEDRVLVFYKSQTEQYPAIALFGRGFPYNPGSITYKYKTLPGISVDNLKQNQFITATSLAKSANVYVNVGGEPSVCEGVVSSGEFIDIIIGIDWLTDAIQKNVYGKLKIEPKVPYTDTGVAMLIHEIEKALQEGVDKGFLAPRIDELGNVQPAYKVNYTRVALVPQVDRQNRVYNGLTFEAYLAGAIHKVRIDGHVSY